MKTKNILTGCIYRNPDKKLKEENTAELIQLLKSLEFSKYV